MLDEPVAQQLGQHRAAHGRAVDVQQLRAHCRRWRCQHTAADVPALAVLGVDVLQDGCVVVAVFVVAGELAGHDVLLLMLVEELVQTRLQGAVLCVSAVAAQQAGRHMSVF